MIRPPPGQIGLTHTLAQTHRHTDTHKICTYIFNIYTYTLFHKSNTYIYSPTHENIYFPRRIADAM